MPTSSKQQDSQLLEQAHTEGESKNHESKRHIKKVDLGDLTMVQKEIVTKMLYQESESFSNDDLDIGCAKDLQMEIRLLDHTPVQKTYLAVPRPLYPELNPILPGRGGKIRPPPVFPPPSPNGSRYQAETFWL